MAAIQGLVLTFCRETCGILQRKLKLLMPVLKCITVSFQWVWRNYANANVTRE